MITKQLSEHITSSAWIHSTSNRIKSTIKREISVAAGDKAVTYFNSIHEVVLILKINTVSQIRNQKWKKIFIIASIFKPNNTKKNNKTIKKIKN